jgi:hypothetical protein
MPIIPVAQEAEIKRITVFSPGKNVSEIASQPTSQAWCFTTIITATEEI